MIESGVIKPNFKKEMIPCCMGLMFLPPLIIGCIEYAYFYQTMQIYVYFSGIITMGMLGIIDDLLGNRDYSGLKGHLSAFFRGKLTTGGLKAIFGGLVSLFVAIQFSSNPVEIVINTLIMALFTNFFNLLDLRPARALKIFFLISIVFFIFAQVFYKISLGFIIIPALVYFPSDLKAKSMMGDAGSNILGFTLGVISVGSFSLFNRILILIFLVLIHILTEKYSLTKIIEKNKILNFFDQLGR